VVWVIMGLIPAVMFATGLAMWWHRVVRKKAPGTAEAPRTAPGLGLRQEPQQVE
jgi:uncharacterized iron-regulated membrane protein